MRHHVWWINQGSELTHESKFGIHLTQYLRSRKHVVFFLGQISVLVFFKIKRTVWFPGKILPLRLISLWDPIAVAGNAALGDFVRQFVQHTLILFGILVICYRFVSPIGFETSQIDNLSYFWSIPLFVRFSLTGLLFLDFYPQQKSGSRVSISAGRFAVAVVRSEPEFQPSIMSVDSLRWDTDSWTFKKQSVIMITLENTVNKISAMMKTSIAIRTVDIAANPPRVSIAFSSLITFPGYLIQRNFLSNLWPPCSTGPMYSFSSAYSSSPSLPRRCEERMIENEWPAFDFVTDFVTNIFRPIVINVPKRVVAVRLVFVDVEIAVTDSVVEGSIVVGITCNAHYLSRGNISAFNFLLSGSLYSSDMPLLRVKTVSCLIIEVVSWLCCVTLG